MGNALGHLHKTERQSYVAVISGVKIKSLTKLVCRYVSIRLTLRFMQQEVPGDQRFCNPSSKTYHFGKFASILDISLINLIIQRTVNLRADLGNLKRGDQDTNKPYGQYSFIG